MDASVLERALARERKRRATAETLLEEKSRELYLSYKELESTLEALRQNKDQLVQSEKMASLGVMSAGIAHEINNPIGFVQSNLKTMSEYAPVFTQCVRLCKSIIRERKDTGAVAASIEQLDALFDAEDIDFILSDAGDILQESQDGITRVSEIVAGLKAFSRSETGAVEPLSVNHCVSATISLAEPHLRHTCEVNEEFDDVPPVLGNAGKLGQVFMNLVVNAFQAVTEGSGRVAVRTRLVGERVHVEVADNGCGISPEHQKKLFEPFFTTKAVGEGTGLGLSISLGIVEEHNGRISCQSVPGEGTTFTVELPVAPDSGSERQPPAVNG